MKKYYVSANTAEGFINHISSNLQNINQVIILKHPSSTLKSAIIRDAIEHYQSNEEIEVLLSSLQSQFLDGVIIRSKSLAIICDQIAEPGLEGAVEVDLDLFIKNKPTRNRNLEEKISNLMDNAYENFAKGLKVHDDLEAIFIKEMDFKKADALAEKFTESLLKGKEKKGRKGITYRRLFGTNTADGVVNEVPFILDQVKHVYHVKGRAGTGKSTFMKKVVSACEEYGFDLELYHCSFDPKSLDMLLVRELDFCIFDSTEPHEFFPKRDGEHIIDLYEEAVNPETDEKYKDEIAKVHHHYKHYMKQGVAELKKAGSFRERYELQFTFTPEEQKNITEYIHNEVIQ